MSSSTLESSAPDLHPDSYSGSQSGSGSGSGSESDKKSDFQNEIVENSQSQPLECKLLKESFIFITYI